MPEVRLRAHRARDRPAPPYIYTSSSSVTDGDSDDYSNLTIFGLTSAGSAMLLFTIWLLWRLTKCIHRRRHLQEHSRRHSQTFSHHLHHSTRRPSNYSFPLPPRMPNYRNAHQNPATPLRSPSRTTEMRSISRMSTFSRNSVAWPLTHQDQQRYAPAGSSIHSDIRDNGDDNSTSSTINKSLGSTTRLPSSGDPSEISVASTLVASTLVAVPLPAHTAEFVGARAGWVTNRPREGGVSDNVSSSAAGLTARRQS